MKPIRNPFKRVFTRKQFDSVVSAYTEKRAILFHKDGTRNTLNTPAAHFWAGYDGIVRGLYRPDTAEYRLTITYIFYRAGQLISESEK